MQLQIFINKTKKGIQIVEQGYKQGKSGFRD